MTTYKEFESQNIDTSLFEIQEFDNDTLDDYNMNHDDEFLIQFKDRKIASEFNELFHKKLIDYLSSFKNVFHLIKQLEKCYKNTFIKKLQKEVMKYPGETQVKIYSQILRYIFDEKINSDIYEGMRQYVENNFEEEEDETLPSSSVRYGPNDEVISNDVKKELIITKDNLGDVIDYIKNYDPEFKKLTTLVFKK